jgi:hypothetical protein
VFVLLQEVNVGSDAYTVYYSNDTGVSIGGIDMAEA